MKYIKNFYQFINETRSFTTSELRITSHNILKKLGVRAPSEEELEDMVNSLSNYINLHKVGNILETNIINEIGDASVKGYNWDWTEFSKETYKKTNKLEAKFKAIAGEYLVKIEPDKELGVKGHSLGFGIIKGYDETDWYIETNAGELFQVLSTVVDIAKSAIKMLNINKLLIVPSKETSIDNRRLRLYSAYIKKQIPSSKVKIKKHSFKNIFGKTGTEEVIIIEL